MSDDLILIDDTTIGLQEALEERYLAYALSTIMNRALPDVRDGLKPVQRRLLYAMRLLKLGSETAPKKSARVVGDVIGRFHPHGEQSIYDALVRLAQDFSQRYPLVDGQGNFGNVDGDNAAAMRYTEAKLTRVAELMIDGLDENTVDFRLTYDEQEKEPVVMPGGFPNLLANGTSGIAVGMATAIPPNNVAELADAALLLIKNPEATTADLLEFIKGPDFATGGVIVETPASILESYETGRGSFRLRARWLNEDLGRGQWQIVITEIPYQVQKSKLIERIATLILDRKIPLLADVRDESAEDIRIVLEPKTRTVNAVMLMESLFKLTELEQRIPLNLNVLRDGLVPEVMGIKRALQLWLNHQRDILVRRSNDRLELIKKRMEILSGLLLVHANIDEVIRIIRFDDNPKTALASRFGLTDNQVEAILNMRLRALNKLEHLTLQTEHDKLNDEKRDLMALIGSEALQWKAISASVGELKTAFGHDTELGKRRTSFSKAPVADKADILEALVEREPITVVISKLGWIRAIKGHSSDLGKLAFKTGDSLRLSFKAQTTDKLVLLTSDGKAFTLGADRLPGGRGQGEPISIMVDLAENAEVVTAFVYKANRKFILASKGGRGFIIAEADAFSTTKKGRQLLNLEPKDRLSSITVVRGDHLAVMGNNRRLLVFPLNQLPEMKRGRGVRLQRYRDASLSDMVSFKLEDGLYWLDSAGRQFTVNDLTEWLGGRAQVGRAPPKGFPRDNRFGIDSFSE